MTSTTPEYHRDYYHEKRRKPMLEYLGGVCVKCGTDEDLEFDHVDPKLKLFSINSNMTITNPKVKLELDKCQLLCKDHHREKTKLENTGFTHGTVYGFMRMKCKCSVCLDAKDIFNDNRNAKRRSGVRGPYKPRVSRLTG